MRLLWIFVEEPQSMVKSINKNDNLIILKSLTKFFAVPVLGLGLLFQMKS